MTVANGDRENTRNRLKNVPLEWQQHNTALDPVYTNKFSYMIALQNKKAIITITKLRMMIIPKKTKKKHHQ